MVRNCHYLAGLVLIQLILINPAWATEYKTLTPTELKAMLTAKDFFLHDVHIPEQDHIPGTDAFIDFRKIRQNDHKLPTNKNTKIVVYCLGGGMSRKAAFDLMELGYTRVYDLLGGTWAFRRFSD